MRSRPPIDLLTPTLCVRREMDPHASAPSADLTIELGLFYTASDLAEDEVPELLVGLPVTLCGAENDVAAEIVLDVAGDRRLDLGGLQERADDANVNARWGFSRGAAFGVVTTLQRDADGAYYAGLRYAATPIAA